MAKKGGLGKGLGALLAENTTESGRETVTLRIAEIIPNRDQPRKQFDDAALSELSESIARHGVLQPLLVRPMTDGCYQLVAGERRWRAARMAGLSEVPVVVREMDEQEAAQLALVENLQREDLNPVEEAVGYKTLMETYGMTQEETSQAVGKSRPAVANALRLLGLPRSVLDMVSAGELSAGHARSILPFQTEERQIEIAEIAVNNGLSVRELEQMAKKENGVPGKKAAQAAPPARDSFYDEVEIALTSHLGRKVKVQSGSKGGTLEIEFYSKDDLRMLANEFEEN